MTWSRRSSNLDRSGTATWGMLPNDYSTTQSGQIIVSGVYIAYIEELEAALGDEDNAISTGNSTFVKFVVVR